MSAAIAEPDTALLTLPGTNVPDFKNRTLWTADNLDVVRGMNSETVDLIYLDPPFNSKRDYAAPIGSEAAGAAFTDTWSLDDIKEEHAEELQASAPELWHTIVGAGHTAGDSMQAYLTYMSIRLIEMYRILKPTGSIYLHCDPTASHYLKQLLDAIFGTKNYRNEIVWKRTGAHGRAKRWGPIHDVLLFYTKTGQYTWNRTYQPYDESYLEKNYRYTDERGRYRLVTLDGPGIRGGPSGQPWRGVDPTDSGRHWEVPPDDALPRFVVLPDGYIQMKVQQRLDVLDAQDVIYWPTRGKQKKPQYKRYLDVAPGNPIQDIITHITPASGQETTGYPTQKPLALLE